MHFDKAGNLIFKNGEGLDLEHARTIEHALNPLPPRVMPRTGDGSSKEVWERRRVAKAMIDAGLVPTEEDINLSDARPLSSRVSDFLGRENPVLVVREDELPDLKTELDSSLDYNSRLQKWNKEGQNSERAQKLLQEIDALPVNVEPVS